jgi:predicted site-specific integrase-resolvase
LSNLLLILTKALGINVKTAQVWHKAGLLRGYISDNKGTCLFEPPGLDAPTKIPGRKLAKRRRFSPSEIMLDRAKEVQYES